MFFRSVHEEFDRAIGRLHALRERATRKRDELFAASSALADQAIRHDDVVFSIEQLIGPAAPEVEAPELTSSDDEESN